jgi:hypothetical protein
MCVHRDFQFSNVFSGCNFGKLFSFKVTIFIFKRNKRIISFVHSFAADRLLVVIRLFVLVSIYEISMISALSDF